MNLLFRGKNVNSLQIEVPIKLKKMFLNSPIVAEVWDIFLFNLFKLNTIEVMLERHQAMLLQGEMKRKL